MKWVWPCRDWTASAAVIYTLLLIKSEIKTNLDSGTVTLRIFTCKAGGQALLTSPSISMYPTHPLIANMGKKASGWLKVTRQTHSQS